MSRIFLVADIHGRTETLDKLALSLYLNDTPLTEKDVIIVLGDHGALYYQRDMKDRPLKYALNSYGCKIVLLKGNHDGTVKRAIKRNPDNWNIVDTLDGIEREIFSSVSGMFVEKDFPNLYYLQDYFAYITILGKKGIALGGGYSVDKDYRISRGLMWHSDEQPNENEVQRIKDNILLSKHDKDKIEFVLSHVAPASFIPFDAMLSWVDQDKVDNRLEELYEEILYDLRPLGLKDWYFGHYHVDKIIPLDNGVTGHAIGINSYDELK